MAIALSDVMTSVIIDKLSPLENGLAVEVNEYHVIEEREAETASN